MIFSLSLEFFLPLHEVSCDVTEIIDAGLKGILLRVYSGCSCYSCFSESFDDISTIVLDHSHDLRLRIDLRLKFKLHSLVVLLC